MHKQLGTWTDSAFLDKPLTELSEMHLGLRPFPKKEKKPVDAKKEDKKESKAEDSKRTISYGEMAMAAYVVGLFGYLVYKAHKK